MQRNPYWPLKGPSFFERENSFNVGFSPTTKVGSRLRAQILRHGWQAGESHFRMSLCENHTFEYRKPHHSNHPVVAC
jgi:hypothetical protein